MVLINLSLLLSGCDSKETHSEHTIKAASHTQNIEIFKWIRSTSRTRLNLSFLQTVNKTKEHCLCVFIKVVYVICLSN